MLLSSKTQRSDLLLDRHVRQWVHADLISDQQAQAIERYESSAAQSAADVAEPERLGLAAEAAVTLVGLAVVVVALARARTGRSGRARCC